MLGHDGVVLRPSYQQSAGGVKSVYGSTVEVVVVVLVVVVLVFVVVVVSCRSSSSSNSSSSNHSVEYSVACSCFSLICCAWRCYTKYENAIYTRNTRRIRPFQSNYSVLILLILRSINEAIEMMMIQTTFKTSKPFFRAPTTNRYFLFPDIPSGIC